MQAHVADVQEIARILLRTLHQKKAMFAGDEPCILYADDLTPSETIQMDTKKFWASLQKKAPPLPTLPFWPGHWAFLPS